MTRAPGITVGITLRPQPAGDGRRPGYAQNRAYVDRIVEAGGVPLCIPPLRDEPALLALLGHCDALLLPGGPDVEPWRYGEETEAVCKPGDRELDNAELLLCRRALETDLPVLAICRGIQLLNVACGGSLYQDVHAHGVTRVDHDVAGVGHEVHGLRCTPGSTVAATVGESPGRVTSFHHQAIRGLGQQLAAVAHADDGIIEGVEHCDRSFVLGVQWHPEDLPASHPAGLPLFHALMAAARRGGAISVGSAAPR